ncbi:MAG: flagellar motor switch protein FliG [Rhodobacter sp.]|uniref:flagellar motor switch protein FliG n=1 Tax=Pararhodobacter sp. TaxID=2127056 RepID=UPI001DD8BB23|nr:FliG C-terminal domain-containing protein [Pararhodobacter sp.]MCB1343802.1 flagellar motor switch protein FliG [Paracoccaceae bacterium]MCC0074012.1 flagellar motor switch protein FliG [Rhodobacter sp.]HPD92317.1 FliG C-terminal domain-containing protein [Pararhodobacter sp.]
MTQDLAPIRPSPPPVAAQPATSGSPLLATSPSGRSIRALTGPQKAAILVRLLLAEGADIKLDSLPEDMQTALTEQIGRMRLIDRDTLTAVVGEFVETLEQVGLSFPGGIDGALKALDGRISPGASSRLKQMVRERHSADPWDRIAHAEPDTLLAVLAPESPEVAAVVLSKLSVTRAAELLGKMPGERARRVAYAVSLTEGIAPAMVARIGESIARELDQRPPRAFAVAPAVRVGAMLNSATGPVRDALLDALREQDAAFAEGVGKAIFTFAHIPDRLNPRDVPKVLREVAQPDLISALAATLPQPGSPEGRAADFLLANMSQRMAASLRDEVETRGKVKGKEAEAALAAVVTAIRELSDAGEITLLSDEDDD